MTENILKRFDDITERLASETVHRDYCVLQKTWNSDVIRYAGRYISPGRDQNALCLGSFLGAFEIALSDVMNKVVAVDHECFLPSWRPPNVEFVSTDLDGVDWQLPKEHFDLCFMIEVLEHLLWSPIPLLKWISRHCGILAISTPDDREWPPMESPFARYGHFLTVPTASPGCRPNPKPMFHCKQYGQAEFVELLDFCGFRVLEFQRLTEHKHQMLLIAASRSQEK